MNLSFKTFFLFFILSILVFTLIASGAGIFFFRENAIIQEDLEDAIQRVEDLSLRTEYQLAIAERTMMYLIYASGRMPIEDLSILIEGAMRNQNFFRAIYIIDSTGKTIAVGAREDRSPLHPDYLGIDFSYTPLYNEDVPEGTIVWSDKFISSLSGDTSIGAMMKDRDLTIITELSLDSLLAAFGNISLGSERVWVIDRKGELVIDTADDSEIGIFNVQNIPFMKDAMDNKSVDRKVRFGNHSYYIKYSRSEKLGWLFVIGIPAGTDHYLIYNTFVDLILFMISFILISLIILPFWTTRLSRDIGILRDQAVAISNGTPPGEFHSGIVSEFRELSSHMNEMHRKIRSREDDLKELNQNLELMVEERTSQLSESNEELKNTLSNLNRMQDVLIQSEKLAALGRMVAGVAHELNTPLGNAGMAVSSLRDYQQVLMKQLESGLRKSDLDYFLEHSTQGVDIAGRNIERAAELVMSFKHVASDQTTSVRRRFALSEIIHDVIVTLQPTIKRTPHSVKVAIESEIQMDSFPGVLGQIISNLINNALIHAWAEEDGDGLINLTAEVIPDPYDSSPTGLPDEKSWVEIRVADDGRGIPPEFGQKIFDPFFTSKMGSGGTGLGLNIAFNSTSNILGGLIKYEDLREGGTVFILQIPASAPRMV